MIHVPAVTAQVHTADYLTKKEEKKGGRERGRERGEKRKREKKEKGKCLFLGALCGVCSAVL